MSAQIISLESRRPVPSIAEQMLWRRRMVCKAIMNTFQEYSFMLVARARKEALQALDEGKDAISAFEAARKVIAEAVIDFRKTGGHI